MLWFRKKAKKEDKKENIHKFLDAYIGKRLEVHYLNQDIPKKKLATLLANDNDFFNLGNEEGYIHICWDRKDTYGKKDAVKRILNEKQELLYENIPLIFNENVKLIDD